MTCDLTLETLGELGRIAKLEEVFSDGLFERLLPEREERAIDIGEAAFQVEGVGEVRV